MGLYTTVMKLILQGMKRAWCLLEKQLHFLKICQIKVRLFLAYVLTRKKNKINKRIFGQHAQEVSITTGLKEVPTTESQTRESWAGVRL